MQLTVTVVQLLVLTYCIKRRNIYFVSLRQSSDAGANVR